MKQRLGVFATLVFFSAVLISPEGLLGQSEIDLANGLALTVQVYNWANVTPAALQRAQGVAGEVLAEAGVQLRWINCPCDKPRPNATTLSLRIIPKLFGSMTSTFRSDHLGFAAVTAKGGVLATVFYDRIQSVGKGGDLANLLGLATAHELGHLLLGSNAHTAEGIMRPYWTRKLLRQADSKQLRFSLEQSQAIRSRIIHPELVVHEGVEPVYQAALTMVDEFEPEDLHTALTLNELAVVHHAGGRLSEAEPLYRGALAIWEKLPERIELATLLSNLARLCLDQEKYDEVVALSKRALGISQSIAPSHPEVANALNNLADVHAIQGRHGEAEPLYRQALAILENSFGKEHPETAYGLSHLAKLMFLQARYAEA